MVTRFLVDETDSFPQDFECDLLRPLEYISRKFMFQTKLIISPPWVQVKKFLRQKAQAPNQYTRQYLSASEPFWHSSSVTIFLKFRAGEYQ